MADWQKSPIDRRTTNPTSTSSGSGTRKRRWEELESPNASPVRRAATELSSNADMEVYISPSQMTSTSGSSGFANSVSRQESVSSGNYYISPINPNKRRQAYVLLSPPRKTLQIALREQQESSSSSQSPAPSSSSSQSRLAEGVGQARAQDFRPFRMRRDYEDNRGRDIASAIEIADPLPDYVEGSRALPICIDDDDEMDATITSGSHEEIASTMSEEDDEGIAQVDEDIMVLDEEEEDSDVEDEGNEQLVIDWFPEPEGTIPLFELPPNTTLQEPIEMEDSQGDALDDPQWFEFGGGVPYLFDQPGYLAPDSDGSDQEANS